LGELGVFLGEWLERKKKERKGRRNNGLIKKGVTLLDGGEERIRGNAGMGEWWIIFGMDWGFALDGWSGEGKSGVC